MFYTPTNGPDGWRALLADPEKHWRTGYSAKSLAYCWEEAKGFPSSVRKALDDSPYTAFHDLKLAAGFPEHKVPFPPMDARPSQNDLFVLGKGTEGLVSIAVEGKVSESFDKLVAEWKVPMSPGKNERLGYLCDLLQLERGALDAVRYQLLHRTASALIEADRFCAGHALMLVHSFSQTHQWFDDYVTFARLVGVEAQVGKIHHIGRRGGVELYLGWVTGEAEYLTR